MAKTLLLAVALLDLCASQAAPATEARRHERSSQSQGYWLSDDLNRLAIWEAPATRRVVK